MKSGLESKTLMQRPDEKELNVDTYDRCKYCKMSNSCNEADTGQLSFEDWLKRVPITKET